MEDKKDKITKIELQKKNENRVNVWVNKEYAFSCSKELVYTYKLAAEKYIELDTLEAIISEDNYLKCKNSALKVIERTYKSEKGLFDKLIEKGYDEKTIISVMEFLKKYNFIDDIAYAKMFIKDKIKIQGKNKIKYELIKKGITEDIIEQELQEVDVIVQGNAAMTLAEKKLKTLQKTEKDNKKIYKKMSDFLMRKGFQWDEIKRVLREILKEDEFEV